MAKAKELIKESVAIEELEVIEEPKQEVSGCVVGFHPVKEEVKPAANPDAIIVEKQVWMLKAQS